MNCTLVMLQGRVIIPGNRFLTRSGEWIWIQAFVTLLYIPNTKQPYAASHTVRVIRYVSTWLHDKFLYLAMGWYVY